MPQTPPAHKRRPRGTVSLCAFQRLNVVHFGTIGCPCVEAEVLHFSFLFDDFCSLLAIIFTLLAPLSASFGRIWEALRFLWVPLGRLLGALGRRLGVIWAAPGDVCNAFWPYVAQKADPGASRLVSDPLVSSPDALGLDFSIFFER